MGIRTLLLPRHRWRVSADVVAVVALVVVAVVVVVVAIAEFELVNFGPFLSPRHRKTGRRFLNKNSQFKKSDPQEIAY